MRKNMPGHNLCRILAVLLACFTHFGTADAQTSGNAEVLKRQYLNGFNVRVGEECIPTASARVGGVLWPAIVQLTKFKQGYPFSVCVTSGVRGTPQPGDRFSHQNGFKVDLRVEQQTGDPFLDNLSQFIKLFPYLGERNDPINTDCGGTEPGIALKYGIPGPTGSGFDGMVFALEYPTTTPPGKYPAGFSRSCVHWDVLSSYRSLQASPATMQVKMGESKAITATAKDAVGNVIPTDPSMFSYDVIDVLGQQGIAVVGDVGNVTGAKEGQAIITVNEFFGAPVAVTVVRPDPPDSRLCTPLGNSPPPCWRWDPTAGGTGGWMWDSSSSNPNPPGQPPAPGLCPQNVSIVGPCWIWDPNANGGSGAWIFIPPNGGSSSTTIWPVTPVGSVDPNDIVGPAGVGTVRFISRTAPLSYAIFFENQISATAPAAKVVVSDVLDSSKFDLSTLSIGYITFPGQTVNPPLVPLASLGNYSTDVDLRPATNLIVRVTASLNSGTGVLTWNMQSLDPTTLQPPTDPLAGFLPPGAEGAVSLTVSAKSSLASGTVVSNQASIVFDTNPPIATPVWSNTLDTSRPSSLVTALPATETTPSFTVNWQGSDTGSGVQDFTVYASDNGSPFTPWQTNTAAKQATFFGQWGHTYAFYSIARDLAGNVEAGKTVAETTTRVIVDTTPPVILPQLSGVLGNNGWYRSSVTINWSVTDPESGISSSSGCAHTTLTSDTAGVTLTCTATNGAGLSSSVPVTIKIDKTPPTLNGMPAANCSLWPPNHKMVQVATVTVADPLSGVAAFSLTGTSSEPPDSGETDIVITGTGVQPRVVQLRAERSGQGSGRIYTLTATATDAAGNSTSATGRCIVPHNQ